MGSREEIFEKLRANTAATYDYPDLGPLESEALTYSDRAAAFCESLTEAGGRAVTAPAGTASEDLAAFVARTLSVEYPGARSVVTAPGVDLSGLLPEEVKLSAVGDFQSPEALDGSDVAVVRARFGVAENGAVWIDDFGKYRALLFIAEALVIVLDRNEIVDNMHQAYVRKELQAPRSFGTFISGPSKTADIEQALVFGAHGARSVTVVLV